MAKDTSLETKNVTGTVSGTGKTESNTFEKTMKNAFAFVVAIVLLIVVKKSNDFFFTEKIATYWEDYKEQKNDLTLETRKLQRWGNSYYISNQIEKIARAQHVGKDDVVLMPTTAYLGKTLGLDYHVPEPSIFYYVNGLKTIWSNCDFSKSIPKYYCHFAKNSVVFEEIKNRQALDSILAILKPYPPEL